jgi:hypothetical protein
MTRGTDDLQVAYHQFGVTDLAVGPFPAPVRGTGLVEAVTGGAVIYTGIAMGPVRVSVEVFPEQPAEIDDSWEEIAEVSLEIAPPAQHTDGEALLLQIAREQGRDPEPRGFRIATLFFGHDPDAFPLLNPDKGPCRLRVHARGRGLNYDGTDFEAHEEYLLLGWPAPISYEVVHKAAT